MTIIRTDKKGSLWRIVVTYISKSNLYGEKRRLGRKHILPDRPKYQMVLIAELYVVKKLTYYLHVQYIYCPV